MLNPLKGSELRQGAIHSLEEETLTCTFAGCSLTQSSFQADVREFDMLVRHVDLSQYPGLYLRKEMGSSLEILENQQHLFGKVPNLKSDQQRKLHMVKKK
jgi:hypothetical protein